jgi:atrazine chlorohydrolase/5-methylthioadenosine/S-adenosylhomocysteine deaminase/melamine deaminase
VYTGSIPVVASRPRRRHRPHIAAASPVTDPIQSAAVFGGNSDIAVATIEAFAETGIRAVYARMFFDNSPEHLGKLVDTIMRRAPGVRHAQDLIETTEQAISHIESLMERFHGTADGRIQVWPAPSLPNITSESGLLAAAELADKRSAKVTLHLAEAPLDAKMYEMTSTEYLDAIGFLSPKVLAAHCVWMTDRDLRILRTHDVKVAHNAISNLYLASGFAPVTRMVGQGLTVGLGSDDANCNESVNLFQVMKFAALVQRGSTLDAAALSSEKVVEMATIDGARAIGMEDDIGSLEVGKKADLIVLDRTNPQLWPLHHIPNALVYQAYGSEVETSIVDGQVVMENRRLTFLGEGEEETLYRDAQAASVDIAQRAGLVGLDRGWLSITGPERRP